MTTKWERGATSIAIIILVFASVCAGVARGSVELVANDVPRVVDTLQSHVLQSPPLLWYDCFTNLPGDLVNFGSISLDGNSIPAVTGITAVTLGLIATDHSTNEFSRGIYARSRTVSSVSDFFVSVGDGKVPLALAGVLGMYGFVGSDQRALRTASQTLEALLATGLVVQTLKHITGRESPSVATSARGVWRPFPSFSAYRRHQSKYHAFPSGHIATTMAAVTVCIENYPEYGWMRPVGYSIVGLVGTSLANKGWHWYSDFPLGIAVGYTIGKCITHPDDKAPAADLAGPKLSVLPLLGHYGTGMQFSLLF